MEERSESLVGHQLVLLGVGRDFVGVHAHHGHLDRTSEVEIVVAQVICTCLKLVLAYRRSIVGDSEKHRLGCGNCCLVRDQVEVVDLVTLELN